jgi:hypothetical protein
MVEQEGADRPETITHFTHPERYGEPLNAGKTLQVEQVEVTDELVRYIGRYGGFCRDCADEDGICPKSGLPCDERSSKAIRFVLEALNYGMANGFVPGFARLPTNSVDVEQRARELLADDYVLMPREFSEAMQAVWQGAFHAQLHQRYKARHKPNQPISAEEAAWKQLVGQFGQSALSGSRLSNEGVRGLDAWLRAEQIDESTSPQHGEHFESWQSGYLTAIDLCRQKLQALASLQPASLSEERMALAIEQILTADAENERDLGLVRQTHANGIKSGIRWCASILRDATLSRGKKNG